MLSVLMIATGRSDASPLAPVAAELSNAGALVEFRLINEDILPATKAAIEVCEPDVVLVLGDRWELLPICTEVQKRGIAIYHIHGGESTQGSFDNFTRRAVSALACMHFVAHHAYRQVLMGMGERNIYVTGAPGLDNIRNNGIYAQSKELRRERRQVMACWHPVTMAPHEKVDPLVECLLECGFKVVWTYPNADPGSQQIINTVGARNFQELSRNEFLRECAKSLFVIGNSSMGIIEAPFIGIPTVNIGTRQDGRIMAPSVLCCAASKQSIQVTIDLAAGYEGVFHCPYFFGESPSRRIAELIVNSNPEQLRIEKCASL